jgi:hypothetical protein
MEALLLGIVITAKYSHMLELIAVVESQELAS